MSAGDDLQALSAQLAATRALLTASTPQDVVAVVATLVRDLGGGLVPARLAQSAAFPSLQAMPAYQQARTREDLRWMARFTAAAVLTDDPTVLDEFLGWLVGLLNGRVPVEVLTTSAHIVADTVEPIAATGARLLHDAADRLQQDGPA